MELRQLRCFVAVAQEGHFGRAAQKLGIAQPPLSQHVMKLESELGFKLFERTNRRVELTRAGQFFLPRATALIQAVQDATEEATKIACGKAGALRLGFVGSAAYTVLPHLVATFRRTYPNVELQLQEMTSSQQASALLQGELDAGLARLPVEEPGIGSVVVLNEPFAAVVADGHRLARRPSVSLSELAGDPFVLCPQNVGAALHDAVIGACRAHGFDPRVVQEAAEFHTVIGLVGAGVGVGLVPASAKRLALDGVTFLTIREHVPYSRIGVVWSDRQVDPVVERFVRVAREICPD